MIARDTLEGLEAQEITEAEALEQTGAGEVDEIYDLAAEEAVRRVERSLGEAAAVEARLAGVTTL